MSFDTHTMVEIDPVILEPLRALCLTYPEAAEAIAFGSPTFQIRSKNFAMVHKPDTRVAVWCKAPPGGQEAWLATDPDRYFAPPYLGPKGWIAAWVSPECSPDWGAIEDIIDESYRLIAPKRLVGQLDAQLGERSRGCRCSRTDTGSVPTNDRPVNHNIS